MSNDLKPVRCRCGGEAKVDWTVINGAYMAGVVCSKCGIKTAPVWRRYDKDDAIAEAITVWNRAMGERTAKVKESWGLAMCCACEKRVFPYDNYCSHCGARLEWDHE